MATITTRGPHHWTTTSETVEYVTIKNQKDDPDVETDIDSATSSVKSWLITDTSYGPDNWPELTTLEKEADNALLGKAVTLLSASEYHERKARNIRTSDTDDGRGTPRNVFFEERAKSKYDEWLVRYEHNQSPETGGSRVRDLSRSPGGRSRSLMDQPTNAERRHHKHRHGWR